MVLRDYFFDRSCVACRASPLPHRAHLPSPCIILNNCMEVPPAENGSIVSAMDTDHHQTDRNSSQIIASYDQTLSQIKSLFGQLAEIKRTPSATLEDKQVICNSDPHFCTHIIIFS